MTGTTANKDYPPISPLAAPEKLYHQSKASGTESTGSFRKVNRFKISPDEEKENHNHVNRPNIITEFFLSDQKISPCLAKQGRVEAEDDLQISKSPENKPRDLKSIAEKKESQELDRTASIESYREQLTFSPLADNDDEQECLEKPEDKIDSIIFNSMSKASCASSSSSGNFTNEKKSKLIKSDYTLIRNNFTYDTKTSVAESAPCTMKNFADFKKTISITQIEPFDFCEENAILGDSGDYPTQNFENRAEYVSLDDTSETKDYGVLRLVLRLVGYGLVKRKEEQREFLEV